MTQEEKDRYVDQNQNWVAQQKNYINGFVVGLRNSKDMVAHHTEYIELVEPQLEKEHKYLADVLDVFITCCKENDIEIPEWAK